MERVDVHELPDSGVGTKEVQALRGEKELRSSSFYDKSSILERMDTTETKQLATGLSAATTKWRHNYYLYVETIQHKQAKVWTCLLSSLLGPEVIRPIKQVEKALSSPDMDAPALESARKMSEERLAELKTQWKAQQPLSKKLAIARGALQRGQRRAEEARVAFTLAQTVKEQADQ